MPLFSVIIPTYNHCDPIIWAIKSVQRQTLQDFEIIVIGDGVPDRTRALMADICRNDHRVSFVDNPKGEAKGELYRHSAIMAAKGAYIAYLGDDDIWHKRHLQLMSEGLEDADFCNSLAGVVPPDGILQIQPGNMNTEFCRSVLLLLKFNFAGLTCVAHRRSTYLSLGSQWAPAPKGAWSDLHMWRKWFAVDGIRYKTIPQMTTIHIDSPGRENVSVLERAKESELWLNKIEDDAAFLQMELEALRGVAHSYGCYNMAMHHYRALYRAEQKKNSKRVEV